MFKTNEIDSLWLESDEYAFEESPPTKRSSEMPAAANLSEDDPTQPFQRSDFDLLKSK
jgi:hypothetical protein